MKKIYNPRRDWADVFKFFKEFDKLQFTYLKEEGKQK